VKLAALTLVLAAAGALGAFAQPAPHGRSQAPASATSTLTVQGLTGKPHVVTAAEWQAMRRIDTTVAAHQVSGRYSGVLLTDLLGLVAAPLGDALRGKALGAYIVVEAADGYRVVFSLAEFDPGYTDRLAIVADRKDGQSLAGNEAPYHLIIPGEKRPARWVRQVVRITLRQSQ
jgi:hypothetical protein